VDTCQTRPDRPARHRQDPAPHQGRCRPEIQNKLFPIIHERKDQGFAIEALQALPLVVQNSFTRGLYDVE
jgi:hypothetical protein